jgi:hypothetical protein
VTHTKRSVGLFLLLLASGAPALADANYPDREGVVKKNLESEDERVRARAFDPLRESDDPRAVPFILQSIGVVLQEQDKIKAVQAAAQKQYEVAVNKKEANRISFEKTQKSGKDLDRYNANEKKISKEIGEADQKIKNLQTSYLRIRGTIDNAVQALIAVLGKMPEAAMAEAADRLEKSWLRANQPPAPESPLWYLDVMAGIQHPVAAYRIGAVADDVNLPLPVRGAALVALADRKEEPALSTAIAWLLSTPEQFHLLDAGIEALRTLHRQEAIEPLINFLKREDIKRSRTDAREALVSLTGQTHGPYHDPWHAWWKDAAATFQMPPKPVVLPRGQEQGGVTFYGIHSFSDRLLFILDVSGSMEKSATGDEGGTPRITIARKEIAAAINSLDDGGRFNVILFNHQVVPWQQRVSISSESTRRQAVRWSTEMPAVGGTNIYDALEAGFQIAQRTTGVPDIDTIMFMTDGRPTAGKIRDNAGILESVKEWNRTARLTIHCVGIGEHDEEFLKKLAEIGHGEYVKR